MFERRDQFRLAHIGNKKQLSAGGSITGTVLLGWQYSKGQFSIEAVIRNAFFLGGRFTGWQLIWVAVFRRKDMHSIGLQIRGLFKVSK